MNKTDKEFIVQKIRTQYTEKENTRRKYLMDNAFIHTVLQDGSAYVSTHCGWNFSNIRRLFNRVLTIC